MTDKNLAIADGRKFAWNWPCASLKSQCPAMIERRAMLQLSDYYRESIHKPIVLTLRGSLTDSFWNQMGGELNRLWQFTP